MIPKDLKTIPDILRYGARAYPRRTAVIFGQINLSYQELFRKAAAFSRTLKDAGLIKGERVALFLDNGPEFVICYFAILMNENIVVPINHMFKREETRYILEDSQASGLITSNAYAAMARELNTIVPDLRSVFYAPRVVSDALPEQGQDEFPAGPSAHEENPQEASEGTAIFLYTSGTTGHPKAAMLSHRNLLSNVASSSKAIRVCRRDSVLCFLPLFHSFAATVCMLMPLFNGAKMVILKSPRPVKKILRAIRKNHVTIFVGIPAIYNILKDMKLPGYLPTFLLKLLNPVRLAISGAAALPVKVFTTFEEKFRLPLLEGYGLTEASPVVSLNPLKGVRKAGSIGLPLPDVEVKIIGENGLDLGVEQVGELCVRGPNVMRGYFKKEEENRLTLKNGWLLTGDMAKIDKDGYISIMGRKKEMVNVRGLNVYPREIEEVLYQNPNIREAAVIGIPDAHRGEVPKGFVVLKTPNAMTEHEIIAYLRERLALYKVPRKIEIRPELPKNSSGKILKRLLAQEEAQRLKTWE